MATSKLQIAVGDLLDKTFPQYRIRENYRPDWLLSSNLTKLELDFYIEELRIGIEVQGSQHFEYNSFFYKSQEDFEKRLRYDEEKKDICRGNKVVLIEVFCLMDAIIEIKNISRANNFSKYTEGYNERSRIKFLQDKLLPALKTQTINPINKEGSTEDKIQEIKRFKKYLEKRKDSGRSTNFSFSHLTVNEQTALLTEHGIDFSINDAREYSQEKVLEIIKFKNFYAGIRNGKKIRKFEFEALTKEEIDSLFLYLKIPNEAKGIIS